MKMRSLKLALLAVVGCGSANAADIIAADVSVPEAGGTIVVPVVLDVAAAEMLGALNLSVNLGAGLSYDNPPATPNCQNPDAGVGGSPTCTYGLPTADQANYGNSTAGAFADGTLFELPISVPAGTAGNMITSTVDITTCDTTCTVNGAAEPGSFTITYISGSSLSGAPASANLVAPINGSVDQTFTFTAMNGSVTGISCAADGGNDPEVTFDVSGVPATLASPNTFTITGSCGGSSAVTDSSGSATCSYTDSNSNPQMATVTIADCDVQPGIAVASIQPSSGGTLTIGPVEAGGSFTSNILFRETANAGTGYTVDSCSIDAGSDPSFTLSGATSGAVPAGGSFSIPVSVNGAVPGATGGVTCTYTINGTPTTYNVNLAVLVQALRVPTLSQWAMILMALALVGFGAYRLRKGGMAA